VITCFLKYEIDPDKIAEFENYAKMWISLVAKFGGHHHGYFLPSEGASDIAYALFSFSSFADYEVYRLKSFVDEECQKAMEYYRETKCFRRYERSFLKPVLE
jgi:antibiotic biosynthesis monooxygenase (ABM) superfamily enzyme